jgi:tripartite-type tricarboxylate transporter receptor subunit TctC
MLPLAAQTEAAVNRILAGIFAIAALGWAALGLAQGYPTKPIKLVVTFPPGGAGDITARLVGDKLSEMWKQQLVIENRAGGGGRIGVEAVFRAPPDGYTLLLASNSHITNQVLFKDLGYDLLKDFTMLGLVTSTPMVLAVTPRVQASSMKEFTALLRANPGKIDYSTCGVATIMHFTFELYKNATHTYAVHIPQRGCGPAAAALAGGQIDVAIISMSPVLPFAKQGRVRMLGLTTAERSPAAPDVPTFRESGVPELKDFSVDNYYGFMAPAALPKEIEALIESDLKRAMASPELSARLSKAGLDVYQRTPAQMAALYRADIAKFARAAAAAGIQPE